MKVPPTRYSRDETAVVRGATGSCVSLVAATVRIQPSGVVTTPGLRRRHHAGIRRWPDILRTRRIGQRERCGPDRDQQARGKCGNAIAHDDSSVLVPLRSDGLGDAEVGDDVVGVIGRARQRRVRADEGLACALIGLDPNSGDGDPGFAALERLLVDRHRGHRSGFQIYLALQAEAETTGCVAGERNR